MIERVAIVGASGFIGKEVINFAVSNGISSIGLSRNPERQLKNSLVEWRECDLFHYGQTEEALKGATTAVYLIHSMLPSARLTEGSFHDFDYIIADNFIRAAKKNNIQKIIYVSGLMPEEPISSKHLASRREVEEIFLFSGIPTTVLRCGIVIGPGGSSFTIMKRLLEKAPFVLCPPWTKTISQSIFVDDLVQIIFKELKNSEGTRVHDLGLEQLSYQTMLKKFAEILGRKVKFISTFKFPPKISYFVVSLFTKAPKDLLEPLIESLQCPMIVDPIRAYDYPYKTFEESVRLSLSRGDKEPTAFKKNFDPKDKTVRSIERLPKPEAVPVSWLVEEYGNFLGNLLKFFIKVIQNEERILFVLKLFNIKLLCLKKINTKLFPTKVLYRISGGLLAGKSQKGRIEFRESRDRKFLLIGIHDYEPRLPWYFYKFTQAIIHNVVMRFFSSHIRKVFYVADTKRLT